MITAGYVIKLRSQNRGGRGENTDCFNKILHFRNEIDDSTSESVQLMFKVKLDYVSR